MRVGSLNVQWTTPLSHYVVPAALCLASRHVKVLSPYGPSWGRLAAFIVLKTALNALGGLYVAAASPDHLRSKYPVISMMSTALVTEVSFNLPDFLISHTSRNSSFVTAHLVLSICLSIFVALEHKAAQKIAPDSPWTRCLQFNDPTGSRIEQRDITFYPRHIGMQLARFLNIAPWGVYAKMGSQHQD